MVTPATLAELIERLEASRTEIASRYERRLHESVSAYRGVALAATGGRLVHLFARMIACRAAGTPFDASILGELDALSASRAKSGIGVGDLFAGVTIFASCAREAVFERTADSDLRDMGNTWSEAENTLAIMIAWMIDQHVTRVVGG